MGQEIESERFGPRDFEVFRARLAAETGLLEAWFREGRFASGPFVAGLELEAWLVDARGYPAPVNVPLLERLADPMVVPELARFNVEINTTPRVATGDALARFERELTETLGRCQRVAGGLGADILTIGILPTVRETDLTVAHMSPLHRYRALNAQVMHLRGDSALRVDIEGREHLVTTHRDVMFESATTSLQVHLQVAPAQATRVFNAAKVVSAPMVAACANAPFLFGHDLWDETRIPLFEQSVAVTPAVPPGERPNRVCFGRDYVREGLFECFRDNLQRYAVLLPAALEEPPQALAHLRLHNGTIWRWNRPLIGFDAAGRPHLRVEHRVVSGPTSAADAVAALALFLGLVTELSGRPTPPESQLPHETARANFYAAARYGLDAEVGWIDGQRGRLGDLLRDDLLPRAQTGLQALGIRPADAAHYLAVMERRLASGLTGAAWQRAFVAAHGRDWLALVRGYRERQATGRPVHEWAV